MQVYVRNSIGGTSTVDPKGPVAICEPTDSSAQEADFRKSAPLNRCARAAVVRDACFARAI